MEFHFLDILTTVSSGVAVYLLIRNGAKKDIDGLKKDVREIKNDIHDIKSDLNSMNLRLTRLEGRFDERGYWESRRTGTEEKKK